MACKTMIVGSSIFALTFVPFISIGQNEDRVEPGSNGFHHCNLVERSVTVRLVFGLVFIEILNTSQPF